MNKPIFVEMNFGVTRVEIAPMPLQWESVLTAEEERWQQWSDDNRRNGTFLGEPLRIIVEGLFVPSKAECRRRWEAGEIRTWTA